MIHMNNTSRPITFRTWTVPSSKVTENNILFLKSKGIPARCYADVRSFETYSGKTRQYAGPNSRVEFETTCKDQDAMLKLIYGSDLILVMEETVLPNSMSQCVLSEIKFE